MAEKISPTIRKEVASRAKYLCEYCRTPQSHAPVFFEVEHIIPTSKGGASVLENLAFACDGCNNRKSDKTAATDPSTGHNTTLFHPRKDQWYGHFSWSTDSLLIIGLTPEGRATVEALHLNRQPLINLRLALFSVGIHPPAD